jgi:2-polyprenyl-3-methyl-5-hydroxy-6-metoxy-1,4-benzoquinol methylase
MRAASMIRGVKRVSRIEDLDARFQEAMLKVEDVTQEAQLMSQIRLRLPDKFRLPGDPFSPEYAKIQRELYEWVAKREYIVDHEATPFDFEQTKDNYSPYNTQNGEFVGAQLQAHGFLIRNLGLKPGARIVEFGSGWGNTAMHLALMGFDVTAVEVNPVSIELMRHRAAIHNRVIRFAPQDMVEFAAGTEERFDAAIFVASFHHCHEHMKLLEHLDRIIKDDGCILFADEPIVPARTPSLPYPWGLRLDGGSLYWVRRHGWLELGFQEKYFREALRRTGWAMRSVPSNIDGLVDLYIANKLPRNGQAV